MTRCIAVLGGSFDPVHNGHVALARYFTTLLAPDQLRVIPAGQPWQKPGLLAQAEQRIDMLKRAFAHEPVPLAIDTQEIERQGATYTIDTLRSIRAEVGADVAIAFLIGADQLQQLHTWKEWQHLFDYAHLCAASRPGFALTELQPEVQREFARRAATPEQIRATPAGLTCIAHNLAIDISATQIRAALRAGQSAEVLIPSGVLDYLKQHHLYGN